MNKRMKTIVSAIFALTTGVLTAADAIPACADAKLANAGGYDKKYRGGRATR